MKKKFLDTKTMILCSLFTALIAIGAFIRIPLPVTVFTMQFIFVLLAGLLLGSKRGALSVFMYVLIGFVGFPIFTEGGGPTYLLKPTFGYLLAFILASYIVGYAREKYSPKKFAPLFIACLIAMVITYGFGSFYTYIILNYVAGSPIPYWACIASLFPITAIKDIVGCLIASVACQRLSKFVEIDF